MTTRPARSNPPDCQLTRLDRVHEPGGRLNRLWQVRNRIKRIAKRRFNFAWNILRRPAIQPAASTNGSSPLQPGDWVRIKSEAEIRATLGNWNDLKGCIFMEEMWQHCGTTQHVFKRIGQFLDERDYQVKKVQGVVILENVFCQGTVDFGPCDRSCFFFWREEWLEKLEEPQP
jgi:hypothetical protein